MTDSARGLAHAFLIITAVHSRRTVRAHLLLFHRAPQLDGATSAFICNPTSSRGGWGHRKEEGVPRTEGLFLIETVGEGLMQGAKVVVGGGALSAS